MPLQTRQTGDLYVNPVLNVFSVAYLQNEDAFIADKVFPVIGSPKPTGVYYTFPKGTFFRTDVERRSPGTPAPRTSWRPDKKTFGTEVFHIAEDLYEEDMAAADSDLQLESTTAIQLTRQMMIKKELDWATAYWKAGVWGRDLAGVASGPSSSQFLRFDVTGSDPVTFFQNESVYMLEATGFRPNTLVISPYIETVLANHPVILDRIKYNGFATPDSIRFGAGSMTFRQALSQLFRIERILVAEAVVNTANETLDASPPLRADPGLHFAFNKSALLTYTNPNPGPRQPSAGYNFSWTGMLGSAAQQGPGAGLRMRRWWDPQISATTIQCDASWHFETVSPDVGTYMSAVVA